MFYWLSYQLEDFFGPFRLLRSHAFLLAVGTFLASFFVWYMLPKLWHLLPHDHGKAILGKDGMVSAGKPTGAKMLLGSALMAAAVVGVRAFAADLLPVLSLAFAIAAGGAAYFASMAAMGMKWRRASVKGKQA